MTTLSNASENWATPSHSSSYSLPFIRCVGWTTSVFTPLPTERLRASSTLSMTSPSRFLTWSMMIWLVKARRTDQSVNSLAMAPSMAPMVRRRLSLKLVPKLTTMSSFSPMPSSLSGSSNDASPVS